MPDLTLSSRIDRFLAELESTGALNVADAAARKNAANYTAPLLGVMKVRQADKPTSLFLLVAADVTQDASWIEINLEGHTHTEYAAANHDHDGVYQPAGSYAATNHNHDGVYQPVGSYALTSHDHDSVYAKLVGITAVGTATRTVTPSDVGNKLRVSTAGGCALTMQLHATAPWTVGSIVYFRRLTGAGALSWNNDPSITINNDGIASITAGQEFALQNVGTNEFDFI